jgi:bifunctional non-homologous end joining protein LigD
MSLIAYRRKRNFRKTAEPAPEAPVPASGRARFVIQKHAATRLHYDLRLEMGRAFKSWAVPKGLPYAKGEKRLAVQVEDHPLAYGDFEGTIPKGQYGGGTVMLWDRGNFSPLSKTPAKDLKGGKLHFLLEGAKLRGEWYLVRLREGDQWLVIKGGEDMKPVTAKKDDLSVLSGKSMKQLAEVKAVEKSTARNITEPRRARKMPPFVEPMMAKLRSTPPPGEWLYEIKFDGWRALVIKAGSTVQLFSRNRTDFTAKDCRHGWRRALLLSTAADT